MSAFSAQISLPPHNRRTGKGSRNLVQGDEDMACGGRPLMRRQIFSEFLSRPNEVSRTDCSRDRQREPICREWMASTLTGRVREVHRCDISRKKLDRTEES